MLYQLLTFFYFLTVSFSLKRNFSPSVPEKLEYNRNKIWLWLSRDCFDSESQVLSFKDELLSSYECLHYNKKKHKELFFCGENQSMWSLWMDLHEDYDDFSCLNDIIQLDIHDSCVNTITYEPIQHIDGILNSVNNKIINDVLHTKNDNNNALACQTQSSWGGFANDDMYNLDIMDGTIDNQYVYDGFSTNVNSQVGAIVLDEGVQFSHPEFIGLTKATLNNFDLSTISTFDHGTHVCGTIVGTNVGNAKNTNIWNYPVCQSTSGCAWSDIQIGYNAAIALMQSNTNMRFVINYSVGGSKSPLTTGEYNTWGTQIEAANGVWVTSAGNSRGDACNFSPAYNTDAITVGSATVSATSIEPTTWFTNYGSCVDVWAPGERVLSSYPGDAYAYMSGTSMASPGVAGLVINLIKDNSAITTAQIRTALRTNSNSMTNVPSGNFAPNNYVAYNGLCV